MDDLEHPGGERDQWLTALRARLLQLARRRVGDDDAEDIVQSTLRVVVERGLDADSAAIEGLPPLAWCFQVLRNVIGNHYKRQRTARRHLEQCEDLQRLPAATTEVDADSRERIRVLERTLEEIETRDEQCGALLRLSIEGMTVREIAEERGLELNALYQRLYRCRRRLRELLRGRGVLV